MQPVALSTLLGAGHGDNPTGTSVAPLLVMQPSIGAFLATSAVLLALAGATGSPAHAQTPAPVAQDAARPDGTRHAPAAVDAEVPPSYARARLVGTEHLDLDLSAIDAQSRLATGLYVGGAMALLLGVAVAAGSYAASSPFRDVGLLLGSSVSPTDSTSGTLLVIAGVVSVLGIGLVIAAVTQDVESGNRRGERRRRREPTARLGLAPSSDGLVLVASGTF